MAQKQPTSQPKTLEITNFSGRLTRLLNGDLNSGFSKFTSSWGYDPFSKPGNLTWLETPTDITGPIDGTPFAAVHRLESNNNNVWILASSKKLFQIQATNNSTANLDSVVGISSVANGTTYLFGAAMSFFGSVVGGASSGDPYIYVTSDSGLNRIMTNGAAEQTVIAGSNKLQPNMFHPLKEFVGKLIIGNGNTVAAVDSTGTSTSSVISVGTGNYLSEFNPPLPVPDHVQDLDVSVDGNYLLVTSSQIPTERLDNVGNDGPSTSSADSDIFKWNGSDLTVTSSNHISSFANTAQQTFLGNTMIFANDSFGASVSQGDSTAKKLLTLPGNKSPLPNATDTNGNFLVWAAPEVVGTSRVVSLYYYGSLDAENPIGLYRVMRWTTTQANAQVFQVPVCVFVNAKYQNLSSATYQVNTASYGKHYIGLVSVNTSGSFQPFLLRFLITPTGSGTPQSGVYETQTQLFSKRISVSQIRVYTEPTVSGNAFQLDIVGADGSVVTNGTFTYAYGDITDPQSGATSLERVNFNPNTKTQYSMGIRITNTGTTNMVIKKIELDVLEEGK